MAVVKTNADGYVKDTKTNTVINNNVGELARFQQQRAKAKELSKIKQDLAALQIEVAQLKDLVQKAING